MGWCDRSPGCSCWSWVSVCGEDRRSACDLDVGQREQGVQERGCAIRHRHGHLAPCWPRPKARSASAGRDRRSHRPLHHRRQTEALVDEASLSAATWSATLDDPADIAAVTAHVRATLEGEVAAARNQFVVLMDPAELHADPGRRRRRAAPPASGPRRPAAGARWAWCRCARRACPASHRRSGNHASRAAGWRPLPDVLPVNHVRLALDDGVRCESDTIIRSKACPQSPFPPPRGHLPLLCGHPLARTGPCSC